MAEKKYVELQKVLNVCEMHYEHCLEMHDRSGDTTADNIKRDIETLPTADVVEVETIRAWLYEMAINNVGCAIDGEFSNACEEIIARLDGLRNFAKEEVGRSE